MQRNNKIQFYKLPVLLSTVAAVGLSGCAGGSDGNNDNSPNLPSTEPAFAHVVASGGEGTNFIGNQSSTGFDTPAANLTEQGLDLHLFGDGEFEIQFIRAISADFPNNDGVGPAFNNNSCLNCHTGDGRGNFSADVLNTPVGEWAKLGSNEDLFLRVSIGPDTACVPGPSNAYCAPIPVPGFTEQLLHRGVLGLRESSSNFTGQADVYVRFDTHDVAYGDGSAQTLYKPVFAIRNPYDQPGEAPGDNTPPVSRLLADDVMISPRMALPIFGLGLLEAVPEAQILALADPGDKDGDGISGRPNYVFDQVKAMRGDPDPVSLGRFGWKANTPSVAVQTAGAYSVDMGVTNYLFPSESIAGTSLHDAYLVTNPADNGQMGMEVPEDVVKAVIFYANTLAVPARRNVDDPTVLRGAQIFQQANCTGCHQPKLTTSAHPGVLAPSGNVAIPAVENQIIYPFTDMLLHDMGEGLADHRPDFLANGREWKTRPLWGIGLTPTVNLLAGYLHDGRARSLEEAVLWHGGEAQASREFFRTLPKADRDALVAFLRSL